MRICGQPCKPSQKHFLNLKSFDGLFTNYFLHLTYSYRPGARHFVQMDEPEQVARLRLEAWGVLVKPKVRFTARSESDRLRTGEVYGIPSPELCLRQPQRAYI